MAVADPVRLPPLVMLMELLSHMRQSKAAFVMVVLLVMVEQLASAKFGDSKTGTINAALIAKKEAPESNVLRTPIWMMLMN